MLATGAGSGTAGTGSTAMVGASLPASGSRLVPLAAGSAISHSGCSQATALSVRPCAVTLQVSSRSPQSAGTSTPNAKLWKRG